MRAAITITLAALATLATSVVTTAQADAAAPRIGGGCNPQTINGWAISSCISEAPGSILKPDYYINGKASGYPSNCYIVTFLADLSTGSADLVNQISCASAALGHHGPWNHSLVARHYYRTDVVVYYNDARYATFPSQVAQPGV